MARSLAFRRRKQRAQASRSVEQHWPVVRGGEWGWICLEAAPETGASAVWGTPIPQLEEGWGPLGAGHTWAPHPSMGYAQAW